MTTDREREEFVEFLHRYSKDSIYGKTWADKGAEIVEELMRENEALRIALAKVLHEDDLKQVLGHDH